MASTQTVTGRVKDASGAPSGRALVSVVGSSVPLPEVTQVADECGGFSLTLPEGTYTIEAVSPDGARKIRHTVTTPGAEAVELVLPD